MKILYIELIGFKRFMLNQISRFEMVINNPMQIILGSNGSGKAEPLDSLIKVPNGWLKMGQMEIGTEVIAKDGTTTTVNGVFPQGLKEIFKITFADGRSAECCADHLWKVYIGGKQYPIVPRIISTLELIKWLETKTYSNLLWVDLIDSEQNADVELPIDPYLLGVFLGDGCSRGSPDITTPDTFIIDEISKVVPSECMISKGYSRKINTITGEDCYTYGIVKKPDSKVNTFTKKLIEMKLYNKLSYDKFIPEIYLHASTKQRLHLLQGLLDTDGFIGKNGSISFSSSSEMLSRGVQYLVRSLGGIAKLSTRIPHYTYLGQRLTGRLDFRIHIRYKKQSELFRLPKKKIRTNDINQYASILKNRIETIESIGFKEAQCISIKHPEHLYVTDQFIVTHNSSLLQQLTPLPPSASDFLKTGSKHITISHDNVIYNLRSVFQPSQKHSFIKDDVELNLGGTITIQRELVKTHFNITPDIHSLMLGEESFDSMSPSRRKEWFIFLCDTNYDYAINVYNKLKERFRDVTGALKLAKKRLISETEKVLKTDEENKIRQDTQILHDNLNFLLENRKPLEFDTDVLFFKQTELESHLLKLCVALDKLLSDGKAIQSNDFHLLRINKENDKITIAQAFISNISKEFEMNQDKIDILKKAEKQTISELIAKLDNQKQIKKELKNTLIFTDDTFDPVSAMNSFLSIKETLSDIFTSIPINSDRKYSSDNLSKTKELHSQLLIKKKTMLDALEVCIQKQKHTQMHKDKPDLTCPKCQYNYSLYYDEKTDKINEEKIQSIQNVLEITVNPEIKKCEEYIQSCSEYSLLYRRYIQCTNNFVILNPYWTYLNDKNIITDNPQFGITQLNIIETDLIGQKDYLDVCKKCLDIQNMLTSLKDVGATDLNTLIQTNTSLQKTLEEYTGALQMAVKRKEREVFALNRLKDIKSLQIKIKECTDNKYKLCKDQIETTRRALFNETIKLMQSDLANKEHILSNVKTQKSIIENINNNITELESEELALSLLIKQLSPVDGLIAEGLFGFIKNFCNQMNSLIKNVWSYPMEIKSCELADDNSVDLDYKFPIKLASDTVSDVSKGSTGMIEIINLAFKIVAMKFLGLQNTPLLLDELGKTLDSTHRGGIIMLIKNMLEQHIFTQTFMISHDFSQYSAMLNVDTCVLCPNNIILPQSYNEHVKMDSLN